MGSVAEAMEYWRQHWMADVKAAYDMLVARPGVVDARMGIAGASCGVFMGLEFALDHDNIDTLALLGGPTDESQRRRLVAAAAR